VKTTIAMRNGPSVLLAAVSVAAMLLSASCGSSPASPPAAATPDQPLLLEQREINVAGEVRSYWISGFESPRTKPQAVLFVLHGGSTADGRVTLRFGFQDIAMREGFVTVHPNGRGEGWNDGRGTDFLIQRGDGADDIAFFRTMIDHLVDEGIADPARIYVTGGSNGGMMTLRLACELSDRLAGVASFSASLPKPLSESCRPVRALPVLLINGDADRLMPFNGGPVAAVSGDDRGEVIGAPRTFSYWASRNGCRDDSFQRMEWPDRVPDDGTRVKLDIGVDCAAPVQLMTVVGGGHRLPGENERIASDPRRARLSGISSQEVSGADYIWAFLKENALTPQ
jgi:polyhydroxybutyrate depolymerase